MHIVLASASPRRRELMEMLGARELRVIPAKGEERAPAGLAPDALVRFLSRQKAEEVAALAGDGDTVIAADTIVWVDGRLFGKPHSIEEAAEMLRTLSGRAHEVFTGVCVLDAATGRRETQTVRTGVTFRAITDAQKEQLNIGYGLEIMKVAGGKLKDAGVPKGFIIQKVNDQSIKTVEDLQDVVKEASTSKEPVLYIQGIYPTGKKGYFAVPLQNE